MAITELTGIIKDPSKLKDIFGSTPTLVDDITIDVLLSETPSYEWDLTKHPVEAGLDVTDSRYKRPVSVTLDCILTNPDFSITNILSTAIGGGNPFKVVPWEEKRDALDELMNQNKFIDVVTPNREYSSMMITSVQPMFDKDKSKAYFFRITLERVETVSSEIVNVDPSQIPESLKKAGDSGAKKKTAKAANAGKKAAEKTTEKKESILFKLVGKFIS
jgi:hypothetical protein